MSNEHQLSACGPHFPCVALREEKREQKLKTVDSSFFLFAHTQGSIREPNFSHRANRGTPVWQLTARSAPCLSDIYTPRS